MKASSHLPGIPTVPYNSSGSSAFDLSKIGSILVDFRYESSVDDNGQTLIPPTLKEFAETFGNDINATFGHRPVIGTGGKLANNGIFLTLGNPSVYIDAAGRETSEGYSITVNSTGATIEGASPLGAWWGTRTLLQQAVLNNGSVPHGSGKDSPGWATRGMMLDVGRRFYPKHFITDMCAYMSFFKQNTFHLHLSDNLFNFADYPRDYSLGLYARIRLWSNDAAVEGLNRFKNESYTREDFDEIQTSCAARGVTILPEIESPGHSLVIVQWKPELGHSSDLSLLNISHPDTIPTVQKIWKTFLPWFHSKTVSIGADEYRGSEAEYVRFVNVMNGYIGTVSNKSIRIWGTFPPKKDLPGLTYTNVHTNVSIQHWEYFEDDPYVDYIKNNYSVLNSNDDFYIVNKYGTYPQQIDVRKTFRGSPPGGTFWYPNIFHQSDATRNPPTNHPLVLGAIAPLWNDYGPLASVYSEAYYAWRQGLPALADKQWGGVLSEREFYDIVSNLRSAIPGQELERPVVTKSSTILNYTFQHMTLGEDGVVIPDESPNGYHGVSDCAASKDRGLDIKSNCSVVTPVLSKGRNYTLSMTVKITELNTSAPATLISGADSSLVLTPQIALFASGVYFPVNATLPLNEWVRFSISSSGPETFVTVFRPNGTSITAEFQGKVVLSRNTFAMVNLAVEAPVKQVAGRGCGWEGQLGGLSLTT
jgi:hexosaminidase